MVTVLPLIEAFKPVKKYPTREEPFSFEHEFKRFKEVFGIKVEKHQTKSNRVKTTKKKKG